VREEVDRQMSILTRGMAETLPLGGLERKIESALKNRRPLRVKLGIDPTTSNVHIGHMVPYRKLREFQDLGHKAILIIGDFTATIGDPSGKNQERPKLSKEEVKNNAATYCDQIFKIVDKTKAEVHFQSQWFEKKGLRDVLENAGAFSVAHLMSHETFRGRMRSGERLSLQEMLYPMLQAWDSVEVEADIELGGMDQKFNILCGRDLQKNRGYEPQSALFLPLLPGTDGQKMSKSLGNSIAVLDSPQDIYGKTMSIADELMPEFINLACKEKDFPQDPFSRKKAIARDITSQYHGRSAAIGAEEFFEKTVSQKEMPLEIPNLDISLDKRNILSVISLVNPGSSKSDLRRLVQQGGVKWKGDKIINLDFQLEDKGNKDNILHVGKRKIFKINFIK